MENIFEGAKFSDKFVTRDGRVAVLIYLEDVIKPGFVAAMLWINKDTTLRSYYYDGTVTEKNNQNLDIVSRYQESIDEDKLDKLAEESTNSYMYTHEYLINNWDKFYIEGYKTGYRKAIEELN